MKGTGDAQVLPHEIKHRVTERRVNQDAQLPETVFHPDLRRVRQRHGSGRHRTKELEQTTGGGRVGRDGFWSGSMLIIRPEIIREIFRSPKAASGRE